MLSCEINKKKKKKKKSCRRADFVVPVDHRERIKESDKRDKYLDFVRELRYQLLLVHLERFPKAWKGIWNSWKSVDEPTLSKL